MSQKAIIIGGGLGGLFTGAILSREGFAVTILEKNPTLGGGLQMFRRDGVWFETGMHVLGGLRPGGSVWHLCRWLGIIDRLELRDVDHDCMDEIHYLADNDVWRVPEGREQFADYFAKAFPNDADGVRKYVDKLYDLANEVDLFYLRSSRDELFGHSEEFLWSADELIAHYINDPRLRDILGYMNPMYGGKRGHTPAYIHALINVLYINGANRFVGGSAQMAQALADVITDGGGTVHTNEAVVGVEVEDRQVVSITTRRRKLAVDAGTYVISDIHPSALVKMVSENAFPKPYRQRVDEIPNTYSAFSVYIVFREESFPYINHTCYMQETYGNVWDYDVYDKETWPRGMMYMTPAEKGQGRWAQKMIVNCIMNYDDVRKWEKTTTGKRGDDYEKWKSERTERVIRRLEEIYPDFRKAIKSVFASSPLTIRDYYNVKEGSLYGFRKDCKDIMLSQVPLYTKVRNLYLTGQNINLHGICGVPLTAINTAEAIVGQDKIINQLKG